MIAKWCGLFFIFMHVSGNFKAEIVVITLPFA